MTEEENFPFIKGNTPEENITENYRIPAKHLSKPFTSVQEKKQSQQSRYCRLPYQKGELAKEDVGIIEVKDTTSYVAVARNKSKGCSEKKLANEKLKGKK